MKLDAGLAVVGHENVPGSSAGGPIVVTAGDDIAAPEILQVVGGADCLSAGDMA